MFGVAKGMKGITPIIGGLMMIFKGLHFLHCTLCKMNISNFIMFIEFRELTRSTVKTLLVATVTIGFDDLLLRPLFEGGY